MSCQLLSEKKAFKLNRKKENQIFNLLKRFKNHQVISIEQEVNFDFNFRPPPFVYEEKPTDRAKSVRYIRGR